MDPEVWLTITPERCALEVRDGRPAHVEHPTHVHVDNATPDVEGDLLGRGGSEPLVDGGVVDQNIERAVVLHDAVDERDAGLGISDVDPFGEGRQAVLLEPCRILLHGVLDQIGQDHRGSDTGQVAGVDLSDALGGTRHNGNFSCQIRGQFRSPFGCCLGFAGGCTASVDVAWLVPEPAPYLPDA